MYKKFQKSTNNTSVKYSFLASFSIIVFLFTFITNAAYAATTSTVTNIGNNEFTEPTGLAVDSSGDNIYVAENSGIKKINISSNTTTAAAVGVTIPYGVALDSSGNIYASYPMEQKICKTNKDGNITTFQNNEIIHPRSLALDSDENIYFVDSADNKIKKINSNGDFISSFDNSGTPYDIAVDSIGNIYVDECFSNNNGYKINKLDPNGNFITIGEGIFSESCSKQIAVDNNDNIYISDRDTDNKNIIYKMNTSGQMEVYASYDYTSSINGITVDNNGNVYVIEGSYVKKITVSPELKIDTANPPNATVGTAYSYQFTSTGGIGEKTYTVTDPSSLPTGLTLSTDGTLSGTPTTNGVSQFTIIATDSEESTSSTTVNLTVSVSIPMNINGANPPNATVGTAYSYTFTSTGGIGTKTYAVTEGSLPSGLKLSKDGTLSGIPTTIGGGTFTITATDSATPIASTSSATVNLAVLVANSSGGSSSGSGSGSSASSSSSGQVTATAIATGGTSADAAIQIPVQITTESNGTKTGKVELDKGAAKEIVDSIIKQGGDTAIITVPDTKDNLASITAIIPTIAINTFVDSGKKLELETPNGGVILSNQNMKDYANTSNQALNFTITPVNDAITQTESDIRTVEQQLQQLQQQILIQLLQPQAQPQQLSALQQQQQRLQRQLDQLHELQKLQQPSSQSAGPANGIINETKERISVLQGTIKNNSLRVGGTVDIESNMPKGISVGVRLPMGPVISPAQAAEIKRDSASYGMIAEHSPTDIEKLAINKMIFKNNTVVAEANTTRFSRFTVIKLSENMTDIGTWENDEQGWKYINNGQPATGWNQIDGAWYFMDSTGVMQTGWKQINGNWYLLKENGTMATGWMQSNGIWYLLNNDGTMATDWQKVNDTWYYLYSDGAMASDAVIDGYTLDASGAMAE